MYKHWMHEGGISTPLLVSYPREFTKHFQSDQVGHIMDIFPTVMELTKSKIVKSVEGKSLVPLLKQKTRNANPYLAWEHLGNRAIREGDWKLVWDNDVKEWELYNVRLDRVEANNLVNQHPKKVKDLIDKYGTWALKMKVK
jgi:arylsulfatase